MKTLLVILCCFIYISGYAQTTLPQVLTLGTFHFEFYNYDIHKTDTAHQIDVLKPEYQTEIAELVNRLLAFQPTIIVIERQPSEQRRTDSNYQLYVQGRYQLQRNEEEQLGFRLAKSRHLSKLYCVDEWGNFRGQVDSLLRDKDSLETKKFEHYFFHNPDSNKRFVRPMVFKTQGILAELRQCNAAENIRSDLGNYLIGLFKYESRENDFTGVNLETDRWFNRNLKIFRNIQRIGATTSDRILIIYGAGHLNLLNYFFDCSPEYQRVSTGDYLR